MSERQPPQSVETPGMEVSRPVRQLSIEADFAVPALQAVATGLAIGAVLGPHFTPVQFECAGERYR